MKNSTVYFLLGATGLVMLLSAGVAYGKPLTNDDVGEGIETVIALRSNPVDPNSTRFDVYVVTDRAVYPIGTIDLLVAATLLYTGKQVGLSDPRFAGFVPVQMDKPTIAKVDPLFAAFREAHPSIHYDA